MVGTLDPGLGQDVQGITKGSVLPCRTPRQAQLSAMVTLGVARKWGWGKGRAWGEPTHSQERVHCTHTWHVTTAAPLRSWGCSWGPVCRKKGVGWTKARDGARARPGGMGRVEGVGVDLLLTPRVRAGAGRVQPCRPPPLTPARSRTGRARAPPCGPSRRKRACGCRGPAGCARSAP